MIGLMARTQPPTQKANLTFALENREKLAAKHSTEKPILLSFANLSITFCPKLRVRR